MATFGQTNSANIATKGTVFNVCRGIGGTSPNVSGMTLTSVSVELYLESPFTTRDTRIAVYTGGTLDNPTTATLLEDFGTVSVSASTPTIYTLNSATNPSIPANTPIWIFSKNSHGDSLVLDYSTNSADSGDWQSARGRAAITGIGLASGTAWPSTLGGSVTFGNFWYAWYLTYSVSSGTSTIAWLRI